MTVTSMLGMLPSRADFPDTWDEYIGQDDVKRQLRIAAAAARKRGEVMPHVLVTGPAGHGKTALAHLIGKELGKVPVVISGDIDANRARVLFHSIDYGALVFYDEFHQLVLNGRKKGDWILTALEDFALPGPRGRMEPIPRFTLVAATTNPGMLSPMIRDRFPKQADLVRYTDDQATRVAAVMAPKLFKGIEPLPTEDNLLEIAYAANNTPRLIRNVLQNLSDLATVGEAELTGNGYDLAEAMAFSGVTPDGLTDKAVRYLTLLFTEFETQAGRAMIAERLGEKDNIGEIESLLMDKGLIVMTKQGRQLTKEGISRAQEAVA